MGKKKHGAVRRQFLEPSLLASFFWASRILSVRSRFTAAGPIQRVISTCEDAEARSG